MDSFVLAETFKYLYLLFADPSETTINLDDYLFTTEAHFLPLAISRFSVSSNYTKVMKTLTYLIIIRLFFILCSKSCQVLVSISATR